MYQPRQFFGLCNKNINIHYDDIITIAGQVLSRENIEKIIRFAYHERLLVLADEVRIKQTENGNIKLITKKNLNISSKSDFLLVYIYRYTKRMFMQLEANSIRSEKSGRSTELRIVLRNLPPSFLHPKVSFSFT